MKTKILFLAAVPADTPRLRLDQEVREIETALERSKSREKFEIIQKSAVQVDDLRRALLDHQPQIVHLSMHGGGENGLAFEGSSGRMKLVSTEALARLFKSFKQDVRCVFLNACFSEVQAAAIGQHIDYVIGMNQEMKDQAAIEFAKGFYDAIAAERSIEDAFELGLTSIDLGNIPASSIPVLKIRKDLKGVEDASNSRATVVTGGVQDDVSRSSSSVVAFREQNPISKQDAIGIAKKSKIVLEEPEGQVPVSSALYVERPPIEEDCYEAVVKPGTLIRVKAPRQMGKTSLMSRVLHHASQQDYQSVYLSFQSADAKALKDLDAFLRWFCATITHELNLSHRLNDYWKDDFLGSKDKCTNYFQRYLLTEIEGPIALGLDEVDEVFKYEDVATDFFGLLRAWHERAKNNLLWQKLRLIITHSKEVYIPLDINQSPFNVGLPIELLVLTQPQAQDLVQRHGLNWDEDQLEQLMTLLGGHPYLVRVALYQIARSRMTLERLKQVAPTEEGPYSDHLRRHLLNLQETKDARLLTAARQVMSAHHPVDVGATEAFKLRSMGLVRLRGNEVMPLCDLYRQYFCNRLGS